MAAWAEPAHAATVVSVLWATIELALAHGPPRDAAAMVLAASAPGSNSITTGRT